MNPCNEQRNAWQWAAVLRWTVALWLGGAVVACGFASEAPSEEAPAEQGAALEGGVVLEPNTIRGQVRFTNQNPEILQILDADRNRIGLVTATSKSPTGFTGRTELPARPNLRGFDFEMSVEAGAGGPGGVTYEVFPQWMWRVLPAGDNPIYSFTKAQGVLVRPRSEQPLPTELNFEECLGAIEFRFGTDETCTTLVPVGGVNFAGQAVVKHPNNGYVYYARGGSSGTASVLTYSLGTSAYEDLRTYRQTRNWSLGCDELVKVCLPDPGPSASGALTGPWELVGEPLLNHRFIALSSGPESNHRYHTQAMTLDARAPASDPSRWWTLPNIVPGTYSTFYGRGYARRGREFSWFYTRSLGTVSVAAGPSVPLTRVINGETRFPFVMRPAWLHGAIRLADPYVTAHPGAYSSLQGLFFEADHDSNGDGIPNQPDFSATGRYSTQLQALGPSSARANTAFPGVFSPTTGELSSGYEQILAYIYDEPHAWRQDMLRLAFWTQGYNFTTRPGQYDPARFRYGYLDLRQKQNTPPAVLQPGQRFRVDHEYCFNEVQLEFTTASTPFFNPTATIKGSFTGTDWRGVTADYTVDGLASGIPAVVGVPAAQANQYAQTSGSVSFTLPQGSYTLTPGATLVNANGSTNQATFQPIQFTLGCGQRLKLVPPLTVIIDPKPTCAAGPEQTVTGVVKSRPAEVDRIWYQLNDGPEVTLCENCGLDPTFSIPVELQTCGNTVRVFAFTAGLPTPATGFQDLVWDDPADGPDCDEAACVNSPPVARCRNVVVAADGACSGCDSVDDGSTDREDGDVSCVQTPGCPYGLGRNAVTLTCTDSQGSSSSCQATVTVYDATPPVLTCGEVPVLECSEGGAVASYAPSATDNCGAAPTVACTPASGSRFTPGTTAVTCAATDTTGNQTRCAFPVTVVDTQAPTLELVGEDPLVVSCGSSPTQGVVATDACLGDISHRIEVVGLNQSVPGTYPVSYRVSDLAGHVTEGAARTVQVVDSGEPEIVLTGNSELTLECGLEQYVDLGAVASDGCGGPLEVHRYNSGEDPYGPGPNTSAEGTYSVQYLAWNATGLTVQALRTVHVDDRTPPTLTLRGSAHLTHTCGSTWVDPGVDATDACYGNLGTSVSRTGQVNGWVEGVYTVQYALTDSGGNSAAPVTRTVEVVDCPW